LPRARENSWFSGWLPSSRRRRRTGEEGEDWGGVKRKRDCDLRLGLGLRFNRFKGPMRKFMDMMNNIIQSDSKEKKIKKMKKNEKMTKKGGEKCYGLWRAAATPGLKPLRLPRAQMEKQTQHQPIENHYWLDFQNVNL